MQFHHHGYVSGEPRVQDAAGSGIDRPADLPDEMDVLIVGSGPAGMLLSAQMSQFPDVTTRIIERREGRLVLGQADGIQPRSVETFQAFGFAERIVAEAYNIAYMNFWGPDPENPQNIIRTARTEDYAFKISEFPHLIVNQARVLDYFAEAAAHGPGRIVPDYGVEFARPHRPRRGRVPGRGAGAAHGRTARRRGAHGAGEVRRRVRRRTQRRARGDRTQAPRRRIRARVGRHGRAGQHRLPRLAHEVRDQLRGGQHPAHPARGRLPQPHVHRPRRGRRRTTTTVCARRRSRRSSARRTTILHPYSIDVKQVAWHSVYEVGHRVTDKFDDVAVDEDHAPHVFLTGDACHTHSAKAGQGMNVSMQDGFNLGWKLGHVLTGLSPESLLATYSAERQPVAQQLIDFDREWSTLMARKPEEISDPQDLATYYLATAEFPSGFMTQYGAVGRSSPMPRTRQLAPGFPIGKRFKSVEVVRVCDGNVVHLGHHAKADGRWRVYAFADARAGGRPSALDAWADWMASAESPIVRHTPAGADIDAVFDVKVDLPAAIRGHRHLARAQLFLPQTGTAGADRLGEGLRGGAQRVDQRRHLRRARAVARRRRGRGAPRSVRRRGAAAVGDRRACGVLRRSRCCRSACPRSSRLTVRARTSHDGPGVHRVYRGHDAAETEWARASR